MNETDSMIEQVIVFVQNNTGKWIESPRNEVFGPNGRKEFKVSLKSKDVIKFEFDSGTFEFDSGTILSIDISVFKLAIEFLKSKKGFVMIGAVTKGLGHPGSLEYYLKVETGNGTKRASHIADLLALANIAELGNATSPSGNKVQGVKLNK